jgi:hypothetical protein
MGFPPNVISDLSTGNPGIKVGEERLFLFLEKVSPEGAVFGSGYQAK